MLRVLLIIVGLILIGIMITIIRYTKAEVLNCRARASVRSSSSACSAA